MAKAPRNRRPRPVLNMGRIGDARLDMIPPMQGAEPGLAPLEYNVILAPALIVDKIGSVFISDESQERLELAMQLGRLVAKSPLAFNYENWPAGTRPPEPGDVVWFARYAGGEFVGMDGNSYRLVKDKDVGAMVTVALPEPCEELLQRLSDQRAKMLAAPVPSLAAPEAPPEPAAKAEPTKPGLDRVRRFTEGETDAEA